MRKQNRDVLVVGLALFAMFFGAGNLIFPPALGLGSGTSWFFCMLGFFITGIGMPLMGVVAASKVGGTIESLSSKVNPMFGKIFCTIVILAVGPLLAIPRTGAMTFEVGVLPIFPGANPIIVSIIYFAITLFFVLKPTGIVDSIGKVLTPILLIIVVSIIAKGIISPLGVPIVTGISNSFSKGFTEGFQTMDALVAIAFGGIIISSLKAKGYNDTKDQINMTIKAGLIAASGLAVIYGGLLYLGATASGVFTPDLTRTELIIDMTNGVMGNFGKVALGLAVSFACLTTSIGLTATVGTFFAKLFKGKISYNTVVIATAVFSAFFANIGVEKIVQFAIPLLAIVYPVAIVLIILGFFDHYITNEKVYSGAVIGALSVSIFQGISTMGINFSPINNIIAKLPFANAGFAWLIPAIIGTHLMVLMTRGKFRKKLKLAFGERSKSL
ncbi:MAG: branched-chain amino acid transport system II carrier protein [Desulfobacteraceae bacterium]|nr:branched-chain amino acid transport system II carrier protein [Desulfobacteraceae bacterium]